MNPVDRANIELKARRALAPLNPAQSTDAFWGTRSNAGRSLPPYYLVYFLLVNLLKFNDLGQSEKVSYSIPVEFNGTKLMIEHRKFGLGIFIKDEADEAVAKQVAQRIHKAVKAAEPYFDSLADAAAKGSKLNVENNARQLFERFSYFSDAYAAKLAEADVRKGERIVTEIPSTEYSAGGRSTTFPSYQLLREASWYATAAIEAFFSWTEHVFILIAVLKGTIQNGEDVAKAAGVDWKDKFKLALDIADLQNKRFYDELSVLRTQVRNFVAHGAFGKNGQALSFHSEVGAVPLLLPHNKTRDHFRFGNGVDFVDADAMKLIHDFIAHLWSRDLSPAKIYIDSSLPLILTYTLDGTYSRAMASDEAMQEFETYLSHMFDNAANMDW